jgi:2-polyprenyl-3-methyl-5-hydroxy-6-metoxy-1,4-benzoquinol methylase
MPDSEEIGSVDCPHCHVCGNEGQYIYRGLKDGLFGSQGQWDTRQCANPECGLLWLDPMPRPDEIGKAYRSYYTHEDQDVPKRNSKLSSLVRRARQGYCASRYGVGRGDIPFVDKLLGRTIGLIPPFAEVLVEGFGSLAELPKGRLLELGCGAGDTLLRMSEWGWNVEGFDFDAGAARNCQNKGLNVHAGDIFEQGYADNSFDAIISNHVIEHVHDARAMLCECLRILRPGGRLVFLTPNGRSWLHEKFGRYWRGLEPPRHLHIFCAESLLSLAEQTKFKNCDVSTSSYYAGGIYNMSKSLRDFGEYKQKKRTMVGLLVSEIVHLYEWLRLQFDPMCGESLKLEASK